MLPKPVLLLASYAATAVSAAATAGACAVRRPGEPREAALTEIPWGEATLPTPEGARFKFMALGFGIQNYSCVEANGHPTATGALAVLYPVNSFLADAMGREALARIPRKALEGEPVPLNMADPCRLSAGQTNASVGADPVNPFPLPGPLRIQNAGAGAPLQLDFAGHHYFNSGGIPTFALDKGPVVTAHKVQDTAAPGSSYAGPEGSGAVRWLALEVNDKDSGYRFIYRVHTAGGASHGCPAANITDSSRYAAIYMFFG